MRSKTLGRRQRPRALVARVALVAAALGLCAPASAASLSRREEAYVRAVGILLEAKAQRTKSLRSATSGARGVRARYPGLDLARIAFPDAPAAQRFADARRKDAVPRQAIEQRGVEVVVLRGTSLGNEGYAARAMRAAWGASQGSPSGEERGEGEELPGEDEPQEGLVTPIRRGYTPTEIVPLEDPSRPAPQAGPASPGRSRGGRPLARVPRRAPAPARKELDVSGQWLGEGAERLAFRLVRSEPDADHYELELRGFAQPTPPLRAIVSAGSLSLSDLEGKRRVLYVAQPDGRGGIVLRRAGGDAQLVPSAGAILRRAPQD